MSLPSPPPSRDGRADSNTRASFTSLPVFHDARELPISPTTSFDLTPPEPEQAAPPPTATPSPPYWLNHGKTRHHRSGSRHSARSIASAPEAAGITLLDNTASEEGQRKNSGCWARGVRIEGFVVCRGNAVVVAGGRASSRHLMGLGNDVSGGLGRVFGRRGGGEVASAGLGNGFGAFVVWNVEVETLEGGTIVLRRRYSEFEKLREELIMTFPNSRTTIPPLPPKSVISKFRPRFLEQRRQGLVYFLHCILLNPEFSGSPVLKDFLFS